MSSVIPEELRKETPATKLAYLTIAAHGPVGADDIARQTGLSTSAVYDAIGTLRERDVVEAHPMPAAPQRSAYRLTAPAPAPLRGMD